MTDYRPFGELNTRLDRINWIAEPDKAARVPGCEEIVSRHIGDHPVCQGVARTGPAEWSRLSDFMTRGELANMPLPHAFYRGTYWELGGCCDGRCFTRART